ncbi:MAG: alpha/beta hydrolase [Acidobacteriota bacterium]|nr:alpha/beta hydrolase [Acidobacteriota bacterium]
MKITPTGRLVDVGGRRLHVNISGSGAPTVILEAGAAATSLSWASITPRIAMLATVITYDRAGLGWSDRVSKGYTALDSAEDLWLLLHKLPVDGPVIVAGHSFGGLIARVFQQRHPERVAGLVLIDPMVRAGWRVMNPTLARGILLSRRGALLARLGVVRPALGLLTSGSLHIPKMVGRIFAGRGASVLERLSSDLRRIPPELWPSIARHWAQPKSFQTMADTLESLPVSVRQLDESIDLGDLPLEVLSAATASPQDLAEHEHDASLSTRGMHCVVPNSGHWLQFDAPDAVAEAIGRVIRAAAQFRPVCRKCDQ